MMPPCKGCPDRGIGCHGRCEKYRAFRAEKDRALAARDLERRATPYEITDMALTRSLQKKKKNAGRRNMDR